METVAYYMALVSVMAVGGVVAPGGAGRHLCRGCSGDRGADVGNILGQGPAPQAALRCQGAAGHCLRHFLRTFNIFGSADPWTDSSRYAARAP